MDLNEIFSPDGHIQRLYCNDCNGHLDLCFSDFHEEFSSITVNIIGLPVLRCISCNKDYWPDDSRFAIVHLHKQAFEQGKNIVKATHQKTLKDFDFTNVPFTYDLDDYQYIPGLKRTWDDGFLTPVFFNRSVLLKYDTAPGYRIILASQTYGTIASEEVSIEFGINKNGKVIMWLGDIAKLPKPEQYYLKSENIESDHSIGSEFYDGKIECIFTDPSLESRVLKARSDFLEECLKHFGKRFAHMDSEVVALTLDFNAPIVDTPKERRNMADTLNKIHLESLDKDVIRKIITSHGGKTKQLGSIKLLQAVLKHPESQLDFDKTMMPFYVLYYLRVACSHLISDETSEEKMKTITKRLSLPDSSGLIEIYNALMLNLETSYLTLHSEINARPTS